MTTAAPTTPETPPVAPAELPVATADDFLSARPRRYGWTILPVAQRRVRFQNLSEAELSDYELEQFQRNADGTLKRGLNGLFVDDEEALALERARLIYRCVVDEAGDTILQEQQVPTIAIMMDSADSVHLAAILKEHCKANGRRGDAWLEKKDESPPSSATSPESDSDTP